MEAQDDEKKPKWPKGSNSNKLTNSIWPKIVVLGWPLGILWSSKAAKPNRTPGMLEYVVVGRRIRAIQKKRGRSIRYDFYALILESDTYNEKFWTMTGKTFFFFFFGINRTFIKEKIKTKKQHKNNRPCKYQQFQLGGWTYYKKMTL